MSDLKVRFRARLKMRDVLERYEDDQQLARAISRLVEWWDIKDPYSGADIPLPEADTSEWYSELSREDWLELVHRFVEWKFKKPIVPNQSAEQS